MQFHVGSLEWLFRWWGGIYTLWSLFVVCSINLLMERSGLMLRVWRGYRREVLIVREMEE